MNELVFLENEEPRTTSLKIAKDFEKQHKDVLEKIRFLAAEISATKLDGYNPQFIERTYIDERGKIQPYFEMNRDGYTELVSNFNGVKAREWKRKYNAAFNKMEQMIIQLLAERKSAEWLEARKLSKVEFCALMDLIRDRLIPQMKAEGASENAIRWVYKNYVSMIQKILGIEKGTRNELPCDLLYELSKCQQMTMIIIKGLLAKGYCYKQIYLDAKQKINDYAQLSLFNQRFITA